MSNWIIGCGYNPNFLSKLEIHNTVKYIELGIKEYIEWEYTSNLADIKLSLHIARSPITESTPIQVNFFKHIKEIIKNSPKNKTKLHSIGFHMSGERTAGIGALGFTSHFHPNERNIIRSIDFIRRAQDELHRQIWIENANMYSNACKDIILMWQATERICDTAGCGLIVDLSHIFIDFSNSGLDPIISLAIVPWHYVKEIHLSGIIQGHDGVFHDGHSQTVSKEIWQLFKSIHSLLVIKSLYPIVTIEHTELIWGDKPIEYADDFYKLQNFLYPIKKDGDNQIIDPTVYASRYIYKLIQQRYTKLTAFMQQKMNLDLHSHVEEWITSFREKNLRLTFDINEVTSDERKNSIQLSDFINFMEQKYAVRN